MTDSKETLAVKLASGAYDSARLRKFPGVKRETVVSCLAKVISVTSPRSEHGQLLMRAMMDTPEIKRSVEEIAVRYLLSRGQAPTAEAVKCRIDGNNARAISHERRKAYAKDAVNKGAEIAAAIDLKIRETGESYTWSELRKLMSWPAAPRYMNVIMDALRSEGWVTTGSETRSMRPGERFRSMSTDYL